MRRALVTGGTSPIGEAICRALAREGCTVIVHALNQYKSGERKNAIMGAQAKGLSTADIKALALWYSSQTPALYTVNPEGKEEAAAK